MITLSAVFRRFGPAYRQRWGTQLSSTQHQAMWAIEHCRTDAMGGHVYRCDSCATTRYVYHSCRNRHCPSCQQDAAQQWLAQHQSRCLPVPHFMLTVTLPATLRMVARHHPRLIYGLLFRTSASAIQALARDPRRLGGTIGMFGVLQTWTRDLRYHPHIHFLIPAICHDPDRSTWRRLSATFLLPVHPLARLIRGTFRAAFQKTPQYHHVARSTWTQPWVVDCRPVGYGDAALRYLAPYIFRVALSNNRLVGMTEDHVTFRYTDGQTKQSMHCTLPVETFMQRFLEHILPKGFVKVRCYGFFRARSHDRLEEARAFLADAQPIPPNESAPDHPIPQRSAPTMGTLAAERTYAPPCPTCGRAMRWVQQLPHRERAPPIGA